MLFQTRLLVQTALCLLLTGICALSTTSTGQSRTSTFAQGRIAQRQAKPAASEEERLADLLKKREEAEAKLRGIKVDAKDDHDKKLKLAQERSSTSESIVNYSRDARKILEKLPPDAISAARTAWEKFFRELATQLEEDRKLYASKASEFLKLHQAWVEKYEDGGTQDAQLAAKVIALGEPLATLRHDLVTALRILKPDKAVVDFFYDESLSARSFGSRARAIHLLTGVVGDVGYTVDFGESYRPRITDYKPDRDALNTLVKRYFKPEDPRPYPNYNYFIADVAAKTFRAPEYLMTFKEWSDKANNPVDVWLDYLSYDLRYEHEGPEWLANLARDRKPTAFERAAALEVLGERKAPGLAALIEEVLTQGLPSKAEDKTMMIEACAAALLHADGIENAWASISDDNLRKALEALIKQLDDRKLPPRGRLYLARILARVFRVAEPTLSGDAWRAILNGKEAKTKTRGKDALDFTEFLGIRTHAERIAFVIDLSDSMLNPLTKEEIESIKRPVITGRGRNKDKNPAPRQPARDYAKELPWDKISTRFDAAREVLKLALNNLSKDKWFTVVIFGSRVEFLKAAPGMVEAKPATIKAVIAELDAVAPRSGGANLYLRGSTNIHGSLLNAFRAVNGRVITTGSEHIDPACMAEGCDALFFLGDGTPTDDDFDDREYPIVPARPKIPGKTYEYTDREGRPHKGAHPDLPAEPVHIGVHSALNWPYIRPEDILRDLRRMNLLRRAEIHCIGLGEADPGLLKAMADLGDGVFLNIGIAKKDAVPPDDAKK